MNIDLLKYEVNGDTTDYVNNLLVRNFLPSILMPTRVTARSATIIDHTYYYEGKHNDDIHVKSGNIFADRPITYHLSNFILLPGT